MSGRDHEPIAAFFPSIDRNLMRDLDRHLRNAAPSPAPPEPEASFIEEPAPAETLSNDQTARPNTADILSAVEQAASTMSEMTRRIQELEAKQFELESTNDQLKSKLGELLQVHQAAEAAARSERERADQAEQIAAQHLSRAQILENDLETALGDLTRVARAITGSLGASSGYQRF